MSAPVSMTATEFTSTAAPSPPPPPSYQIGTAALCRLCGVLGHRSERCISHLLPNVILATPSSKKHRVEELCRRWRIEAEKEKGEGEGDPNEEGENKQTLTSAAHTPKHDWKAGKGLEVLPSKKESELILLRSPSPIPLVKSFQTSTLLNRHFDSLFVTRSNVANMEGLSERVLEECMAIHAQAHSLEASPTTAAAATATTDANSDSNSPLSPILRIQTYPKSIRNDLLTKLSPRIQLNPRDYTHVLFVVNMYGKYFFGVESKDLYVLPIHQLTADSPPNVTSPPNSQREVDSSVVLSRAYHKMEESFLVDEGLAKRIKPGCRVIDIGSSPGGWSNYLSLSQSCHVLSIDPGMVHCTSPLVRHVPKLIQNSLDEIKEFATADHPLDLIVCDMNVRPEVAVDLIRLVCNEASISPKAMLVLTVKETMVGRSKKLVQDSQAGLAELFGSFRVYHLLSNGKERTLIGDYLNLSKDERELRRLAREKLEAEQLAEWTRLNGDRIERSKARSATASASAENGITNNGDGKPPKKKKAHYKYEQEKERDERTNNTVEAKSVEPTK